MGIERHDSAKLKETWRLPLERGRLRLLYHRAINEIYGTHALPQSEETLNERDKKRKDMLKMSEEARELYHRAKEHLKREINQT